MTANEAGAVGARPAVSVNTDGWTPLYDDVKVNPSALPTVDIEALLRKVMTDACDSPLADRFNLLDFRPSCNVGEVIALAVEARRLRAVASDLNRHLKALCDEGYEHRYEPGYPCAGCYQATYDADAALSHGPSPAPQGGNPA